MQKKEIKSLLIYVQHLKEHISNFHIDIGLKNQEIRELKIQLIETQRSLNTFNGYEKLPGKLQALVTNEYSIRKSVDLLNLPLNKDITLNYNEIVVYSHSTKRHFSCIKLANGIWMSGTEYNGSIETLPKIELIKP